MPIPPAKATRDDSDVEIGIGIQIEHRANCQVGDIVDSKGYVLHARQVIPQVLPLAASDQPVVMCQAC